MIVRRPLLAVIVLGVASSAASSECVAQCCLDGLFGGCHKRPPAYAVAPVMAPVVAPVPAPPPPVVVPVQQVSYVPETTYRTEYKCVPVTSYKPTTEVDPCTGCSRECVAPVTQYMQQAVNVPVTQYRAVYSTKYVQMQPGYNAAAPYAMPAAGVAPMTMPGAVAPAASPFASAVQTTPQAWGAAGSDVSQQLIQPGQQAIGAPALQPAMQPQPGFQQPIVPQGGTYAAPLPTNLAPQPTAPPALSPTPSLRPIPELQRTPSSASPSVGVGTPAAAPALQAPSYPGPSASGQSGGTNPAAAPSAGQGGAASGGFPATGPVTMPVVPGSGPAASTNAFPRLLAPTGHSTSWRPGAAMPQPIPVAPAAYPVAYPTAYPTAALPGWPR